MAEPRREELAPMFAEFGVTVYQAQLLEEALRLLLLIGREYAKTQIPNEAIRYPVSPDVKKTLGKLFDEVTKIELIAVKDQKLVWAAIRVRNLLVHGYWDKDRTLRTLTPEGRRAVVEELKKIWRVLRDATAIVHKLNDGYLAANGANIQRFMDQASGLYVSNDELPDYKGLIQ